MPELDDKELFESAIAETPAETVETTDEPAETNDGPVRDDQGRFASKEAEPVADAPVQEQPVAKPDEAHIPSWRLREEREAREAAERRFQEAQDRASNLERQFAAFQQQQKPQEQVDPWADLPGHIQQTLSPYDQRINALQSDTSFKMSRLSAMVEHGKDAVLEMEKYIQQEQSSSNPQLRMLGVQMQNSDDPVGVAMQWYQRDKLQKETGGDINAYRNRILEEAMKDPAFQAKVIEAARQPAQPGTKPNSIVQLPPSINRATSSASPHDDSGSLSDRDLYAFATR